MFRIKICGITTAADAEAAVEAGATAIGLNFYPGSRRHLDMPSACDISRAIGQRATKVGVFVNASAEDINAVVARVGLDAVQLHGDEPPELLAALGGVPIVRAFRDADPSAIETYLAACARLNAQPAMLLGDGAAPEQQGTTQYGGTGVRADWERLGAARFGLPLVLAGGLLPENVAEAIAQVRPAAVDTASGVETSPGRKSRERMQAFVEAASRAFAGLGPL